MKPSADHLYEVMHGDPRAIACSLIEARDRENQEIGEARGWERGMREALTLVKGPGCQSVNPFRWAENKIIAVIKERTKL